MGVHRSQFELERVLDRYGATDFAFAEADASAAIQFAMDGRYVELALPLPDPHAPDFTHTSSGRPRTVAAQERAYEQALREHWRGLLLAVRGKLQSVESGLSTFEDEFRNFLAPHLDEKKTKRERTKPRAVNWLLGSSHTVAIALVAAFLVPASAVGAFALPPTVVGHLAAPFRGALPNELGVPSDDGRAVALGQSIWARQETAPTHLARPSHSAHRGFAATLPQPDEPARGAELPASDLGGLRYGTEAPTPPPPPGPSSPPPSSAADQPDPKAPAPAKAPPRSLPEDESDSQGPADESSGPSPSDNEGESTESEPAGDAPMGDDGSTSEPPADEPETGQDNATPDADPASPPPPGPPAPPAPGNGKDKDNGHDNGNHNGADNGNGDGNGNGNGNGNGDGNGNGNGNGNGKTKGQ